MPRPPAPCGLTAAGGPAGSGGPSSQNEPSQEANAATASSSPRRSALARLRLEEFAEGLAARVLHLCPRGAEGPTIAHLYAFSASAATRSTAGG